MSNYNADAIKTLDFREAIRERVAMYMGSADNQGVLQCIREIITNSIDEATMGFGNKINVTIDEESNSVTITDFGRGVPFGEREDGTDALIAIYTMPHSGGKFSEGAYKNAAGLNGIGAKGTALSSDYFRVISQRDGKIAELILEKGIVKDYNIKNTNDTATGTKVTFIPSQEVYNLEPIRIDFEEVRAMCRDWSYLTKSVHFNLTRISTNETFEYYSKNGLKDLVKECEANPIHKMPLYINLIEDDLETEIVMQWTDARRENWRVFTNGLENPEGGTSLTGIKTAITNYFKKKIKEVPGDVYRNGLYYAVSCKIPNPSFANQTKTKINNQELRGFCQRATTQALSEYENKYPKEFGQIINFINKQSKAEAAAQKARESALKADKEVEKNLKNKVFAAKKLKDARKLGQDSVLLIAEGDSAMNALAPGRDPNKYGLLQIRGKILNALSNSEEKAMENEEIKLIFSALGVRPNKYNAKKLRYGQVGFATDADSDGSHIALLLLAFFEKYIPEMLEEGRIFRLEAPLYKHELGKKRQYFYSDEELSRATLRGGELTRFKGLGEMNPDTDIKEAMFGEEQVRTYFKWDNYSDILLQNLMGEDSTPRKEFLFEKVDFSTIQE